MKAVASITIILSAILFQFAAAFGQETTYEENASADQRAEVIYDSGKSEKDAHRQQMYSELRYIEQAYTNTVRYYNKSLTEAEALQIARYVIYYADQFRLDARLLMSVIAVESRFRPEAVSCKGAMGLGQLMPGTAKSLGVSNAFDVQQNIYGTARYLRAQYDRWAGHDRVLDFMLAAYNAGPEAVARHNGIPPISETQNYVVKVKKLLRFFVYGY